MGDEKRPDDDDFNAALDRLGQFCDGLMPDTDGPEGQDGYRTSGRYFEDVRLVVGLLRFARVVAKNPAVLDRLWEAMEVPDDQLVD